MSNKVASAFISAPATMITALIGELFFLSNTSLILLRTSQVRLILVQPERRPSQKFLYISPPLYDNSHKK